MKDEHGLPKHPKKGYNWLPDFVYGGIDGAVTTFAVVAGVEGASLSIPIILILGFANLFADGFSMASGKYSSDKASLEQYEKVQEIEFGHLETKPEREREEIEEILFGYGFKGKKLNEAVEVFISNPDAWVDLMMRNEFSMTKENLKPFSGAIATFVSFILVGFIPLMGYTLNSFLGLDRIGIFILASISTLIALFIVGTVKARFIVKKWFVSGLETMFIGGFAATIAYLIGYLLKGLF